MSDTSGKVTAPFSADQVEALDKFQREGRRFHPFTCGNRGDGNHRVNDIDLGGLIPTTRGWICQYCGYTQDWAHAFMANPGKPPWEDK